MVMRQQVETEEAVSLRTNQNKNPLILYLVRIFVSTFAGLTVGLVLNATPLSMLLLASWMGVTSGIINARREV